MNKTRTKKVNTCEAVLFHGSGHMSKTNCQLGDTPHKIHYAKYGYNNEVAYWNGKKKFTGFWDEPPKLPPHKSKSKIK